MTLSHKTHFRGSNEPAGSPILGRPNVRKVKDVWGETHIFLWRQRSTFVEANLTSVEHTSKMSLKNLLLSETIFQILLKVPWRIRLAKVTTLSAKMKVFSKSRRQYCILAASDRPEAPKEASLGVLDRVLAPMENMRFA